MSAVVVLLLLFSYFNFVFQQKAGNIVSQYSAATKGNLLHYTCIQVVTNLFRAQLTDVTYFIF